MKQERLFNVQRAYLVAIFLTLLAFLIGARLVYFQLGSEAETFRELGDSYLNVYHTFYPPRGNIYDRWGYLLAGNQQAYEVAVDIHLVENPETIAFAVSQAMAGHLGYDYPGYRDDVFAIASRSPYSMPTYLVVADYVTEDEIKQLQEWSESYAKLPISRKKDVKPPSLSGLVYRLRPQRYYPEGSVASNVLGFVNWKGEGVYGLEERFSDLLGGEPYSVLLNIDPNQAPEMQSVKDFTDLILTIDRELQIRVERILDQEVSETGAEAGSVVVMDPKTGEILAMASTPRIDLNHYWQYEDFFTSGIPLNRAVSLAYEPGSVFKVLTMAAALDSGVVEPDTIFVDTGSIYVGELPIHNWDYGAYGPQDMTGCLQHSLNVCLAWIAQQMGPTRFYSYMQAFGLGHLTYIDLAGETVGRLRIPGDKDWHDSDLGRNSFGQGVSVTIVQMLMAVSAVANDGQMVMPHVLRATVTNGQQYMSVSPVVGAPITAETARTLTDMLATSLESESSNALVEGYKVAGKTGTAQIPTRTGYDLDLTHASFVGWGPVDDPKFLVYVWLEKPTKSIWGSVVAAPLFSRVFWEAAQVTQLPPDHIRWTMGSR